MPSPDRPPLLDPSSPPSSILIIGAGVFGLSTALAFAQRPAYAHTAITLLEASPFPNPQASSVDSSRIIRADYSDPAYASLAARAQSLWRTAKWGGSGRYTESGLLLCADRSQGEYVRKSCANVQTLQRQQSPTGASSVLELHSPAEIAAAANTGGGDGCATWGYLNRLSGWADAEASLRHLHSLVEATQRVTFVTARATSLIFSPPSSTSLSRVLGAHIAPSTPHFPSSPLLPPALHADTTLLATGAWTPHLLDLRPHLTATAQTVAYLPLHPSELHALRDMPVILNLSTGCFVTPPHKGNAHLKIARHAYGFSNPTALPHPEHISPDAAYTPSVPSPTHHHLPPSAEQVLRDALPTFLPRERFSSLLDRPFSATRLCWYTDTPSGDFLVDRHPAYEGLGLVTGGSGHGFKFLPVMGDVVVEVLEGRGEEGLRERWAWKEGRGGGVEGTEDGSRAGGRGEVLERAMGERVEEGEARRRRESKL